jgi:hypothetical protein
MPSKVGFTLLSFLAIFMISSVQVMAQSSGQVSVVQAVAPLYPQELISPRPVTGDVRINVRINPDGTVARARAIGGHPTLIKVAESAARRWLFSSTDAHAGMRIVQLFFTFKLVDYKTPDELGSIFKPPYEVEVRAGQPLSITRETGLKAKRHMRGH